MHSDCFTGAVQAIGCANIGMLYGDESDIDEESCQEYVRLMARPFLPRGGETRHPALIAHQNWTVIEGDTACNGRGWLLAGPEHFCSCFWEAAGPSCADVSPQADQRPKAAITYLLYGSDRFVWLVSCLSPGTQTHGLGVRRYFEGLEASIRHISASFLQEFPFYDILVFHSANFKEDLPDDDIRRNGRAGPLHLLHLLQVVFLCLANNAA